MSFVIAQPEMIAAAAGELASIRSAINAANAAAAAQTTGVMSAAADEVSTAVAALF
ncbi:PE family protein, partial [Mycobacterium tuberculosis]